MINGHRIPVKNLDKPFWPQDGYTKGDVMSYLYKGLALSRPPPQRPPALPGPLPGRDQRPLFLPEKFSGGPALGGNNPDPLENAGNPLCDGQ